MHVTQLVNMTGVSESVNNMGSMPWNPRQLNQFPVLNVAHFQC